MGLPESVSKTHVAPRIGRTVSLDQAAQLLGVSRRTIYYRIRDGRLQTVRTIGGSQRYCFIRSKANSWRRNPSQSVERLRSSNGQRSAGGAGVAAV